MASFDIDGDLIRKLADLLRETGLTEVEFAEGERRIRVTRQTSVAAVSVAAPAGWRVVASVTSRWFAAKVALMTCAPLFSEKHEPFTEAGASGSEKRTVTRVRAKLAFAETSVGGVVSASRSTST